MTYTSHQIATAELDRFGVANTGNDCLGGAGPLAAFAEGYEHRTVGRSLAIHADCFDWLSSAPAASVHAIVTDPPYGVKEYELDQLDKRTNGNGGVWRLPPSFDGHTRAPLPRFTALNGEERVAICDFFATWARLALRVLRPGGHVFLASNALLAQLVFSAIAVQGFEYRGQIIRLVRTLRGGDRPKNAEEDFPGVCTMPRSCHEPWGVFRKPIPSDVTVAECLRRYQTGALRRKRDGNPFEDVIASERTPQAEREIAGHPSLKPQLFLRQLVHAALPLGVGIVLDPFMGSGSTLAAAEAVGYSSVGVERHGDYYAMSREAIPRLARLATGDAQSQLPGIESL